MWNLISRLFTNPSPQVKNLDGELQDAAARCVAWAGASQAEVVGARLARLRQPGGLPDSAESLVSDAAAWVGEHVRCAYGGQWIESPQWGLVLEGIGGVKSLRLIPLAVVEKQLELGARFSLEGFLAGVGKRIAAERDAPDFAPVRLPAWESIRESSEPAAVALALAEEMRAEWKSRLRNDLPFTLVGVRELDGWLRSHYFVNRLEESTLVGAGFFVGEVARGLFGGEWSFRGASAFHEAALRFPELDYFPIGRIYKQMDQRPEGEKLDEYIRLVPSARKELRQQSEPSKESP